MQVFEKRMANPNSKANPRPAGGNQHRRCDGESYTKEISLINKNRPKNPADDGQRR